VSGPRAVHPGAWWLWALALAGGATATTNPLLLALIATVSLTVAVARREQARWALTLRLYVWLAVCVVVIRVAFRVVFGAAGGGLGPVALDLPAWHLPSVGGLVEGASDGTSGGGDGAPAGGGLVLFGPVTWDGLYLGLRDGMRLACLVLAVGAANVLASPKRVLAALPGALRQVGTAVVVALTVFPSLAASVGRVRRAARLRGPAGSKHQAIHRIVFPVLADSLDRSLELAASLESRGYGVTARPPSTALQAVRAGAGVVIMVGLAAGALTVTSGREDWGWPLLALSLAALAGLMRWLGRDLTTTRLSRQRWGAQDWMIAACALGFVLGLALSPPLTSADALHPGALAWPSLPWPALLGLAAAATPAWASRAARPKTHHPSPDLNSATEKRRQAGKGDGPVSVLSARRNGDSPRAPRAGPEQAALTGPGDAPLTGSGEARRAENSPHKSLVEPSGTVAPAPGNDDGTRVGVWSQPVFLTAFHASPSTDGAQRTEAVP
jgi:energy-coupling factor transport system permease protein